MLLITVTSVIGMVGVMFGLSGFKETEQSAGQKTIAVIQRVIAAAGGLLLIYPGWVTDLIGIALVALGMGWHYLGAKKQ